MVVPAARAPVPPEVPSSGRGRNLIVGLALSLFSLAAVLFTAEVAVRAYRAWDLWAGARAFASNSSPAGESIVDNPPLRDIVTKSADPEVVYELRPGLRGSFLRRPLATNSYGMRDGEKVLAKPPGMVRIAGVGDSIMFGWGVGQEDTYLKVVERALIETGQRFETLNFAVPGYNTAIEIAVFERRAMQFAPDVVVVHFVNNDWQVPAFMGRPLRFFALDRSFLWEYFEHRFRAPRSPLLGFDLRGLERQDRSEVLASYAPMLGPEGFLRAMDRLAALTAPQKIPVIILYGTVSRHQKSVLKKVRRRYRFHLAPVKPFVERFFAQEQVTDDKEKRRELVMVSPTDAHPNAQGHRLYAEALLDALGKVGVLTE